MKELTLIRHARARLHNVALADIDHPLAREGVIDAHCIGEELVRLNIRPDLILASPAERALSTARIIAEHVHYENTQIKCEPKIYEGQVYDLYTIIRRVPNTITHVFLVGHNPQLTDFASDLIQDKHPWFPNCGTAHIVIPVIEEWAGVGQVQGTVKHFIDPKRLQALKNK